MDVNTANKNPLEREPWHALVLRMLVWCGAVLLFAGPLLDMPGLVASLAAVPLGLLLARRLAPSAVRSWAIVALAVTCAVSGLVANHLLGSFDWVARLLGTSATLVAISVTSCGLIALSLVVGLRSLSFRYSPLALLEAALLVGAVIFPLLRHHESVQQPLFLADWAYSHGYDPAHVLMVIGLLTLAGLTLLLVKRRKLLATLASLAAVWLVALGGFLLILLLIFVVQGTNDASGSSEKPPETPDTGPSSKPSDKPVAVVNLHAELIPAEGNYYFREATYSKFDQGQLKRPTDTKMDADANHAYPTTPVNQPVGRERVRLGKKVPITVCLITHRAHVFGLLDPQSFAPRVNPNPKAFVAAYNATCQCLPEGTGVIKGSLGDPGWSREMLQYYLACPSDPRYKKLIDEEILGGRKNVPINERIELTKKWIEENIIYNKETGHVAADPAADMLWGERQGRCVHVAYAMTYLLRAQGIYARMSAGYLYKIKDRGKGASLLLRECDGHAWCEVYIDGIGWFVIDPSLKKTAPSYEPDPPVNPDTQRMMGDLGRGNSGDGSPKKSLVPPITPDQFPWWWLLVPPLALLGGLYLVKAWRRCLPRIAPASQLYRLCYRASLDRLAEVGLSRQLGETREEFARRLADTVPELQPMTSAHLRRAVGVADCERQNWLDVTARIGDRVRARFSRPRRLLGTLNPVSWLWAR